MTHHDQRFFPDLTMNMVGQRGRKVDVRLQRIRNQRASKSRSRPQAARRHPTRPLPYPPMQAVTTLLSTSKVKRFGR